MRQDTAKKEDYSLQGRGSDWEEEEPLKQLGNEGEEGRGCLALGGWGSKVDHEVRVSGQQENLHPAEVVGTEKKQSQGLFGAGICRGASCEEEKAERGSHQCL